MRTTALILLLAWAAGAWAAEEEPSIQHKPLSQWMQQLRGDNRGLQVRAARVLSEAPTNAWPKIIEQVIPVLKSPRENDKFVAAQVLGEYGPAARAAVPHLLPVLEGTEYERNRAAAAKALGRILKDAKLDKEVEEVAAALTAKFADEKESYSDVKRESVYALGMIGPAAKSGIPKLTKPLTEPGYSEAEGGLVRKAAAWTCGRMGPLAVEHLDRLISMMHKDGEWHPEIVEAIGLIGAAHQNVVPNIVDKIESADGNIDAKTGFRAKAFGALQRIGPKAEGAVAYTKRFLSQPPAWWDGHKMQIMIEALKFLQAVGPKARECMPEVEKLTAFPTVDPAHGPDLVALSNSLREEAAKLVASLKGETAEDKKAE